MRLYSISISLALLVLLSASCSRQVTSLHTTSRLQTASLPTDKAENMVAVSTVVQIKTSLINEKPTSEAKSLACQDAQATTTIKNSREIDNLIKKEAKVVKTGGSQYMASLVFTQKPTAERDYPQINKAGFILIAGGLLGLLLHLILVACIILLAIGLIILISPLFRKRY